MGPKLSEKIVLGTVQFGLKYGIANRHGQVREDEAARIIAYASRAGVQLLDTSAAYGTAESVVGETLQRHKRDMGIVTKLPRCALSEVQHSVDASFSRLRVDRLYGYLVHHFEFFREYPAVWEEFKRLKESGRSRKIGFSLYSPSELEQLFASDVRFDLIQIPFSVVDQRFAPYLSECTNRGVEVHARSAFLQGLLLRDPAELPAHFGPIRENLLRIRQAAESAGVALHHALLSFVASHPGVSKVVIGVESLEDLAANLAAETEFPAAAQLWNTFRDCSDDREEFVLPTKWPKLPCA